MSTTTERPTYRLAATWGGYVVIDDEANVIHRLHASDHAWAMIEAKDAGYPIRSAPAPVEVEAPAAPAVRVLGTTVGILAEVTDRRSTTYGGIPLHDAVALIAAPLEGWKLLGWDDELRAVSPAGRLIGCEVHGDRADALWSVYDNENAPGGDFTIVTGPVSWRYAVATIAGLIMLEVTP